MDSAFIEKQTIEAFGLNDREFEHNYRVDVTEFGVGDSSLDLQIKLDEEYARLVEDRRLLREFVFRCVSTNQPHYLPVNLHRILQNAIQIFHTDRRKPSDLKPAHIVDAVHELEKRLIIVRGVDPSSQEAQENSTLNSECTCGRLLLHDAYWRHYT